MIRLYRGSCCSAVEWQYYSGTDKRHSAISLTGNLELGLTVPSGQKMNRLAYGNAPAVMMKYVKPSADGVIGVPPPQVVVGG